MNMGQKIESLRKEMGMTLEELGNKVGVGKSTVRKWENGMIANMRRDKIAKIANALNVSPGYLMGWDGPEINSAVFELTDAEQEHITKYRLLDNDGKDHVEYLLDAEYSRCMREVIYYAGKVAAAGQGVYIDGTEGEVIKVKNKPRVKDVFAIGVNGDSMEPTYFDGEEVYVQPTTDLEFGEIGLWQYNNELFIKEYAPDGLRSHNPKYQTIKASPEMKLIGKVLGKVKR